MTPPVSATIRDQIDKLYRSESRRVFGSLVGLLKDFDLADDAMHEAYAAAIESWQRDGVPANPRAWLISTGKFKAINSLHRQGRLKELEPEVASRLDEVAEENAARAEMEIEDDRLRLIFTCCYPAIDPKLQVPLTLREVCGLTTEEIARAFLTSKATMAQRIVPARQLQGWEASRGVTGPGSRHHLYESGILPRSSRELLPGISAEDRRCRQTGFVGEPTPVRTPNRLRRHRLLGCANQSTAPGG
jgi:RNA polymerase sigma factor (sigma-70 family)